MLNIGRFPHKLQREIYEQDRAAHIEHVGDWFSEDVTRLIHNILSSDPKWALVDVGMGDGYLSANRMTGTRRCGAYWSDNFELAHVTYDLDGLYVKDRNPLTECDALMQHVGLTLTEAMVFNVVRSRGDVQASRGGEHSKLETGVDCSYSAVSIHNDDPAGGADYAFMEFLDNSEHPIHFVTNDLSPFFIGVNVFTDLLDEDYDALRGVFYSAMFKVHAFFEELHTTIRDALKSEWDYMTSFEYWLEDAEANGRKFDPENYDINIEEIENA